MAGLLERVRSSVQAFRHPDAGSWSPYSRGAFVSSALIEEYDYLSKAGLPHENAVFFIALSRLVTMFNEAPPIVRREAEDGAKIVPGHKAALLLRRPNPDMFGRQLIGGVLYSLEARGDAYVYKVRSTSGAVVQLLWVPTHMMWPFRLSGSADLISGYAYQVDGQVTPLPKSDVIHLRHGMPDPANPMQTLSPARAVLREICSANEAAIFTAAILRSPVPGIAITPEAGSKPWTPEQRDELRDLVERKLGGEKRGQVFATTANAKLTALGFSPEQLALDKIERNPIAKICGAIGFDPMVLGLPSEQKTYSNFEEARQAAYESKIIPTQEAIAESLTFGLLGDAVMPMGDPASEQIHFDTRNVRVLQPDQDKLYERVSGAYNAGWIKRKTALSLAGLPFDETADDVYKSDATKGETGDQAKLRRRVQEESKTRRLALEALLDAPAD